MKKFDTQEILKAKLFVSKYCGNNNIQKLGGFALLLATAVKFVEPSTQDDHESIKLKLLSYLHEVSIDQTKNPKIYDWLLSYKKEFSEKDIDNCIDNDFIAEENYEGKLTSVNDLHSKIISNLISKISSDHQCLSDITKRKKALLDIVEGLNRLHQIDKEQAIECMEELGRGSPQV